MEDPEAGAVEVSPRCLQFALRPLWGPKIYRYIDEIEFRLNSKDITDPSWLGATLNVREGRWAYNQLIV